MRFGLQLLIVAAALCGGLCVAGEAAAQNYLEGDLRPVGIGFVLLLDAGSIVPDVISIVHLKRGPMFSRKTRAAGAVGTIYGGACR